MDINTYLMGWRGAEGGNGWGIGKIFIFIYLFQNEILFFLLYSFYFLILGGVMQNNVIGEQLVKGMGLEQAMKNVFFLLFFDFFSLFPLPFFSFSFFFSFFYSFSFFF